MLQISLNAITAQLENLYHVCAETGDPLARWIYDDVSDYVYRKSTVEYCRRFINMDRDKLVEKVTRLLKYRDLSYDHIVRCFKS